MIALDRQAVQRLTATEFERRTGVTFTWDSTLHTYAQLWVGALRNMEGCGAMTDLYIHYGFMQGTAAAMLETRAIPVAMLPKLKALADQALETAIERLTGRCHTVDVPVGTVFH